MVAKLGWLRHDVSPVGDLIVSLLYKPDAQARESSNAVAHPSLARRACMIPPNEVNK